ncbi:uncharacterized protein LOC129581513 [Paramacrobiotus metropolitanus]|uniref:uncharacterized protein LOC129581513 n=1 Tax=Paramacrobiotus metropolitanus TaxID=2943436 RepID=UPI0024456987|nr:uncharacterized protein LOC129581513 [Paramacrobiotus metropolitanus]
MAELSPRRQSPRSALKRSRSLTHPLSEEIREPLLPLQDGEETSSTSAATNHSEPPRATMVFNDAEARDSWSRRSSPQSSSSKLLRRSFSLPRSTFDPSPRPSMPALSQFSNWDQLSQASTSSPRYSSLFARKDSVMPRASLTPLHREPLERFNVALEDFVTEMVPNNLYEIACKHLPQFTKYYGDNFVKCVGGWMERTTDDTLKMLRESAEVASIEKAIEIVALSKSDPLVIKEQLRLATPAGALAMSKVPKMVAKNLRYQQKLLDKLRSEKAEKEALVAEKVQLLMERHRRLEQQRGKIEEMVEQVNASGSFAALLDAYRQDVLSEKYPTLDSTIDKCFDE